MLTGRCVQIGICVCVMYCVSVCLGVCVWYGCVAFIEMANICIIGSRTFYPCM